MTDQAKITKRTGTCQICGGQWVVTKNGTISHHGYRRPDAGWQTRSCYGARHLPYELSTDRIPFVIQMVRDFIVARNKFIQSMMDSPPDTLEMVQGSAWSKPRPYPRPENFDPNGRARHDHYSCEFHSRIGESRAMIIQAENTIVQLTDRLENWKPVAQDDTDAQ